MIYRYLLICLFVILCGCNSSQNIKISNTSNSITKNYLFPQAEKICSDDYIYRTIDKYKNNRHEQTTKSSETYEYSWYLFFVAYNNLCIDFTIKNWCKFVKIANSYTDVNISVPEYGLCEYGD